MYREAAMNNRRISMLACAVLAYGAAISSLQAQSRNAWILKNYHFPGPPPAGSIQPEDPVVSELRQIQSTLLSIMRKADFAEDYEAALAFATQAAATAQLIGTINARLQSVPPKTTAEDVNSSPPTPTYALAFKDHSIEAATSYWTDDLMLHYMTRQGAHVQVRRNLLDRDLTIRLNRMKNLDFSLPE